MMMPIGTLDLQDIIFIKAENTDKNASLPTLFCRRMTATSRQLPYNAFYKVLLAGSDGGGKDQALTFFWTWHLP